MIYDVVIAGAGVTGGMLARELTKYKLSVCLLEKENDVAMGASKANSGIIHGGFDPEPGTLKARLNAEGVPLLYEAARQLHVPHKNNGSLVVAFGQEEEKTLDCLLERGRQNGISGMERISGEQARAIEPGLSPEVTGALLVTTAGIICPYALTIAAVGNAMDNGADFKRNFHVTSITKTDMFTISSRAGETVKGRYFVNCAGGFADRIAQMAGDGFFKIIPRAGEYLLLDKSEGKTVSHTVFGVPSKQGKGILVTPTADGNLLLGPTAQAVESPESTATSSGGLAAVAALAKKSVPGVNTRAVITSFCGVRASEKDGDFIIRMSDKTEGLLHVAAIDSPGLSSCVAIARYAVDLLEQSGLALESNPAFNEKREDTRAFEKMAETEKNQYIKELPAYGRIICRCETVSEGEILDAIHRNPGALDVDGVKRRTRSGMGRCQGGFCAPYVMKLLARENGMDMTQVTKKGGASGMVVGEQ